MKYKGVDIVHNKSRGENNDKKGNLKCQKFLEN